MKLFVLLLALLSPNAFAATTGTLLLQGTVAANCNVVVTPNGDNLTLNITGGETNKLIASVNETCNAAGGYKINIKSDNAGELRHTANAAIKTNYSLTYGGQGITPTANFVEVKNVTVLNTPANVNSEVRINVTAFPNAMAGTYNDTVTVQIVSNN